MKFSDWLLTESNLEKLYNNTVKAFPNTTKRQHSIDFIKINELHWTPYMGLKTLFIKGLAQNLESKKEYHPIIVFKKVNYVNNENSINIQANNGGNYSLERISDINEVIVRCDCQDFYWRGNYYNHLDKSLFGTKRAKYESQGLFAANPQELPMLCKHLIKLCVVLEDAGIFNHFPLDLKTKQ